jgi:hypothetical protein
MNLNKFLGKGVNPEQTKLNTSEHIKDKKMARAKFKKKNCLQKGHFTYSWKKNLLCHFISFQKILPLQTLYLWTTDPQIYIKIPIKKDTFS